MVGRFRTAPRDRRSVSFVWSGDQVGQGWGIDESRGGMRTYATMLRNRPDFLIHSGDHIYADIPVLPEVELPNGEIWKNLVTEEKTKSAETLAEFRGNWKYGLLDNNMPLALIRIYDPDRNWGYEAIAQGDNGPPRGRELELADILSFIKRGEISNTVWLTADVHYTAAHYFDPNQAAFQDFDPFWEFVSGPIHAGTGALNQIDKTFGRQVVYAKARPTEQNFSGAPSEGLQFFGHVSIDGMTEVMTITLKDVDDHALWSTRLEPKTGNLNGGP